MSKLLLASLFAVAILLVAISGCGDDRGLAVHPGGVDVVVVTVTSPNLERPVSLGQAQRMPLKHGPYTVAIRYADGQTAWLEFFHADAGKRRTVDLYVTREIGSDAVDVRETINSGDSLKTLFTGSTRLQDTSEQKPYLPAPCMSLTWCRS